MKPTPGVSTEPRAIQKNILNGVSCASPTACWAVGSAEDATGVDQALVEEWNGTTWSIVGSPDLANTSGDILYGVACSSATQCWAGGVGGDKTLVEGWTGAGWTIATSPNQGNSQMDSINGVACAPISPCFVVGSYLPQGDLAVAHSVSQTLIAQYPIDVPPASVLPATGSSLGGSTVTVSGSDLTGATAVKFGTAIGTNVRVLDDNTLTVVAPPGAGTVDVTVTTPNGTSPPASSDKFTYVSPGSQTATVASTRQFALSSSDGTTWQPMTCAAAVTRCSTAGTGDSLKMTLTPGADGVAVVSASADLWTAGAGYNQDLGIFVTGGAYPTAPGRPETWKESGGFAGTYSPNATEVQAAIPVTHGVTYTFDLRWKTNRPAAGVQIDAGAGPIGNAFSPARMTAVVTDAGQVAHAESTRQFTLANSDGRAWHPLDCAQGVSCSAAGQGSTAFTLTPAEDGEALLSGSADLWTQNAGYNQDLAIFVNGTLVAWKESGGFAGTYSPNAAYVHAVIPVTRGTSYHVALGWKTNRAAPGVSVSAGAGPIGAAFSPTSLVGTVLASGANPYEAQSTHQYSLSNSDGATWQPMGCTGATTCSTSGTGSLGVTVTPTQTCTAVLRANADLWTHAAGYNQDIAIFVNGTPVAWKESGGGGGAFSPNAASAEGTTTFNASTTYTVDLRWKSNRPAPGVTISSGAGSPGAFSPTVLTVLLSNCS